MSIDKELLLLRCANYLIEKEGYVRVDVRNIAHELWVNHPKKEKFNLIRISIDTGFNLRKVDDRNSHIIKAIASVLQQEVSFLDLSLDTVGESKVMDETKTQVLLTPMGDIAVLKENFPLLNQIFESNEEQTDEVAQLKEKILKPSPSSIAPKNTFEFIKSLPKVTLILLILIISISILINGLVFAGYDIYALSIFFGAYYKTFILANGEVWRFLTAGFVHTDLFHLAMNAFALMNLGNFMERIYGPKRFLITILSGIVMGSLFVFSAEGNALVMGISGGLYAVLGIMLVYLVETGLIKQKQIQSQVFRLVLINVMINFIPQISFLGHLGGFITGLLLGLVYTKHAKWQGLKKHALVALILLVVGLGGVSLTNQKRTPLYGQTDIWVIEMSESFGLTWYAERLSVQLESYYTEVLGDEAN